MDDVSIYLPNALLFYQTCPSEICLLMISHIEMKSRGLLSPFCVCSINPLETHKKNCLKMKIFSKMSNLSDKRNILVIYLLQTLIKSIK